MSKYVGKKIEVEIFGESHADEIGAIVKGLAGYPLYEDTIKNLLLRRKASSGVYSTSRIEPDEPIFSGVCDNVLTDEFKGIIKNVNVRKSDYDSLYGKPRPSHADYAWYVKDGALDFSGGGRFSGRLTAAYCIAGGECLGILGEKGVKIAAYVQKVGAVDGESYRDECKNYETLLGVRDDGFPSLSNKEEMLSAIKEAAKTGDSVGAKIECVVYGFPAGIGDNLFGGLEGKIAEVLYAIPAVKGVEFGYGFDLCALKGSEANDGLRYENSNVVFESNRSGGINGGISNGNVLTIGVAMRPTPSISLPQATVDLVTKTNATIEVKGRHDPCLAVRALPVVESAVALALLDEII
ncbi:MAG: chorismate synthase [Clostridia bacterium]|nr:chorismate synthase [Clostridia bacterium]